MQSGRQDSADDPLYSRVGATLLVGLMSSMAVMLVGLVLLAARAQPAPSHVLPLANTWSDLIRGKSAAVLGAGILLLFFSPLTGVLVGLMEFLRTKDWTFVAVAALLLVIVAVGFGVALR
ncbi:MAG: DUF1634 domain-containing protein [Chloroflexota bacterium]